MIAFQQPSQTQACVDLAWGFVESVRRRGIPNQIPPAACLRNAGHEFNRNNKSIINWIKAHPSESLNSSKVEDILQGKGGSAKAAEILQGPKAVKAEIVSHVKADAPANSGSIESWANGNISRRLGEAMYHANPDTMITRKASPLHDVVTGQLMSQGMNLTSAEDKAMEIARIYAKEHNLLGGGEAPLPSNTEINGIFLQGEYPNHNRSQGWNFAAARL